MLSLLFSFFFLLLKITTKVVERNLPSSNLSALRNIQSKNSPVSHLVFPHSYAFKHKKSLPTFPSDTRHYLCSPSFSPLCSTFVCKKVCNGIWWKAFIPFTRAIPSCPTRIWHKSKEISSFFIFLLFFLVSPRYNVNDCNENYLYQFIIIIVIIINFVYFPSKNFLHQMYEANT